MSKGKTALLACALVALFGGVGLCGAQTLEKTISLAGVAGRIDHLAYDAEHQRLYVAALGNNTVEIVDIQAGKVLHTIGGLSEPQGLLYEPQRKQLWVANGGDGSVRLFDAMTFQPVRSIPLGDDADNIRRDTATGRVLVGYGSGGIAIFDPDGAPRWPTSSSTRTPSRSNWRRTASGCSSTCRARTRWR